MITLADIQAAKERLKNVAHVTPILTSSYFNQISGNQIFFKCENFQKVGAFKFRGAYNALSKLSDEQKKRGIVAFSSGNHAQGVALAARLLGILAKIVMPSDAPQPKLEATRGYGAEVILYDRHKEDREAIARKLAQDEGRAVIPPFDHPDIIAGQGTIALEILDELKTIDILISPVGGGGLIGGNALALKSLNPNIKVYGVEIENGNDVYLSLKEKKRIAIQVPKTLADGIQTTCPGELNFEIMSKHLDGVLLVNETEMMQTWKLILERLKIVIEPTSAVALAAILKNELNWRDKRIAVILSGGNAEFGKLKDWL